MGKVEHNYFLLSDKALKAKGHKGYDTKKYPAISTKYDTSAPWDGIISPYVYYEGCWYYISEAGNICKYNFKTNKTKTVVDVFTKKAYSFPCHLKAGQSLLFEIQ